MEPSLIVILVLVGLFVLLVIRTPIAIALIFTSTIGVALLRNSRVAWSSLATAPYEFTAHWSLTAIPMFLLMGALAYRGGLTSSLFKAARMWLSSLPGGLAVATNLAAAMFAAASGSSIATTSAMTKVAAPEMIAAGYKPSFATGVIAASGTIGALIPPSVMFIVYGWFTEQPINKLLMAGLLPGILTAVIYAIMIVILCKLRPDIAPNVTDRYSWKDRIGVISEIWPVPFLMIILLGSIYTGFATVTESAAIGAVATIVICLLRRSFSFEVLRLALDDALRSTSTIFFIALGAFLFARFMAVSGVPYEIGLFINDINLSPLAAILLLVVLYLILGMFLDPVGIMLITLPIFLPIFNALDMNLIWVGVICVKMIEIGLLTPPVGLNIFVVKSVLGDQIKIAEIFRGVTWFLAAEVVIMFLLMVFS
jgi:C4-dicarboxylate transporter, DctM subunit